MGSHSYRAHLDPDLDLNAGKRPPGWRPIFGQSDAALGHLHKEGVGPGDLFLFFGWFQPVELVADGWRFVRDSQSVHAIWGWMQIADVHPTRSVPGNVAKWAAGHPHLSRVQSTNDGVFLAADELVVAGRHLPGAGTFPSGANRVLTAPPPCALRSAWRLPAWMHPDEGLATLSYHRDPQRWSTVDADVCGLRSVSKGQEFVLKTTRDDLREKWLRTIFDDVESR